MKTKETKYFMVCLSSNFLRPHRCCYLKYYRNLLHWMLVKGTWPSHYLRNLLQTGSKSWHCCDKPKESNGAPELCWFLLRGLQEDNPPGRPYSVHPFSLTQCVERQILSVFLTLSKIHMCFLPLYGVSLGCSLNLKFYLNKYKIERNIYSALDLTKESPFERVSIAQNKSYY